jgi:hypothetical protein
VAVQIFLCFQEKSLGHKEIFAGEQRDVGSKTTCHQSVILKEAANAEKNLKAF